MPVASERERGAAALSFYALCVAVSVAVMLRSAWISDDALITFRSLDHFVNGNGLRWNLAERVQSYTHPLWLFLLAPFYYATREAFYTPIFLSLAVSTAALLGATWPLSSRVVGGCSLLLLIASKAFVDYSASGLENPLSFLLLAAFFSLYLRGEVGRRRLLLLTLLAALLALNRLDVLLLVAPVMALALYESARNETTRPVWLGLVVLGSLPLVVWSLFSLLYYGSLISNTAYAKLNTGIPAELLVRQGINYLRSAFHYDPVTPVLIAAGVAAATFSRDRAPALIALGVVLYIVYVVRIGGDFMAGRFLAAPVLCAVMILSHFAKSGWRYPALTVAALALALASPYSPLRSGPDYHNQDQAEIMRFSGVADERGFYYQRMGLFGAERQADFTPGAGCRSDDDRLVVRGHCGGLGFDGFTGCEDAYLVDRCALAEPLLARLPVVDLVNWRIGHFFRRLPAGYVESLETGENAIRDPHLRRLYEDVALVTRGDLLSWLRLRAIYRLHFHDYGI